MAAVNPSESAQPSLNDAYKTEGNPASKEPAEQAEAKHHDNAPKTDERIPSKQTSSIDEATPTSMARGVRGAGSGEDPSKLTDQEKGTSQEVHADQLETFAEDKIADAEQKKPGAGGGEPGLETDLDRKKAEQAPLREKVQNQEKKEVDVGGVLGQRGGPANPVDKDNYPNKGA